MVMLLPDDVFLLSGFEPYWNKIPTVSLHVPGCLSDLVSPNCFLTFSNTPVSFSLQALYTHHFFWNLLCQGNPNWLLICIQICAQIAPDHFTHHHLKFYSDL